MSIKVNPDLVTRKKLVLVKQLYQRAEIQSFSESNIDRIMSVITFDLAIETALKAVIRSLDPIKTPSDGFENFLQQAESLLNKNSSGSMNEVPDRAHIKSVHSIRNSIQHEAIVPDKSVVSDCRTYTRDFLQRIIIDVWGLSFKEISLTDLIQDARVKKFLSNAEESRSQGDNRKAVEHAAAGLSWCLLRVKTALVGPEEHFVRALLVKGSFGEPEENSDLFRAFEKMQETLLCVTLGMNCNEYMHYKQIAGTTAFTIAGEPHYYNMEKEINSEDTNFIISYCVDTILQIENLVGSIEKPFGQVDWY